MFQKWLNKIRLKGLPSKTNTNVLVVDDSGDIGINTGVGGDITGVTIQTDSGAGGKASDINGSADFKLLGGEGIDITNSTTTITVIGENASTSNKGVASFSSDNFSVSSGAVTIKTAGIDLTDEVTGVLATENQKHKACFEFKGYGTSDGTNYEMPELMTDDKAPFEHDKSTGSDGLTAQTIQVMMRAGGIVMPYTGVLKKFTGWVASAGTGTVDVGIFKSTPIDNDANNVTPVLLVNEQVTAAGNTKMRSFSETSSFDAGFTAGDILYSAVLGGTNNKAWYFSSTLEVEWS